MKKEEEIKETKEETKEMPNSSQYDIEFTDDVYSIKTFWKTYTVEENDEN